MGMVEKLAHIQCTQTEIAATLGVSVDTLTRRKEFAEVYKRGCEGGRKSLRRMQFEAASKGNVTMQIWLGKQYLGQTDHSVSELRQGGPLTLEELARCAKQYLGANPALRHLAENYSRDTIDVEFAETRPARQFLIAGPTGHAGQRGPDR